MVTEATRNELMDVTDALRRASHLLDKLSDKFEAGRSRHLPIVEAARKATDHASELFSIAVGEIEADEEG